MMSERERHVGFTALAGTLLQGCSWWAVWSGYTDAGLALSFLSGSVVLSSLWRSGALDRTPAAEPVPDSPPRPAVSPGEKADQERSLRLLKAIDEAAADGSGEPGELSEFERIVLYGVADLPGREYPPPGHGYPRL